MELHTKIEIAASATEAWTVLGAGFASIGEWATMIDASSLDGELAQGAVRTCHIRAFGPVSAGVVKERLLSYEPEHRRLSYEAIEGLPGMMARALNRWSVVPLGPDRCEVHSHATVQLRGIMALLGPLLRWQMGRAGAKILKELAHRVERGEAHPRKAASGHSGAPG